MDDVILVAGSFAGLAAARHRRKVAVRQQSSRPGGYTAGDPAHPGMSPVTTAAWQGATTGISASHPCASERHR
ncbi:hypothetical protein [Xanthomonas arboricola]|uniref:hypothetical protein n=1 Tax=Xanthomonas arboricola TaxID=56448 RepID=UPI00187BA5F7|nr:hypothetical protein [Xanthomonas arboricola]